jgi:acetyl-CoA/propionyl-CoA carboxylase biotin carboxyl carrier protein
VRVDSGVGPGSEISPMYDPMVAKLIVWDADREQATRRMLRALEEYEIEGLKTLIPFHRALLRTAQWARGETCRDLLEDAEWLNGLAVPAPGVAADEADVEAVEREYTVEVSGRRFDVKVIGPPGTPALNGSAPTAAATPAAARPRPRRAERTGAGASGGGDALVSPLQGNMWKVLVEQGQTVEEGQLVCIIEAMKMENEITAHKAGRIAELPISEGAAVTAGDTLAVISS